MGICMYFTLPIINPTVPLRYVYLDRLRIIIQLRVVQLSPTPPYPRLENFPSTSPRTYRYS